MLSLSKQPLDREYFDRLHSCLKVKIPHLVDINFPSSPNHVILLITVIASQATRDQVTAKIRTQLIAYGFTTTCAVRNNLVLLKQVLKPSGNVERKVKAILQALDQIFIGDIIDLSLLNSKKLYGIGLKTKAIVTSCILGKKTIFVDINVLRAFRSYSKRTITADQLHLLIEKHYLEQGPELVYRLWYYRKKYCKRRHCDKLKQCVSCINFWPAYSPF